MVKEKWLLTLKMIEIHYENMLLLKKIPVSNAPHPKLERTDTMKKAHKWFIWGNMAVEIPMRQLHPNKMKYLNFGNLSSKIPEMNAPRTDPMALSTMTRVITLIFVW